MLVTAALLAAVVTASNAGYPVKVGGRDVVSIRADVRGAVAEARAARATYALELALDDPECGPEGIAVVPEAGALRIEACGRLVLDVAADDGAWEGRDAAATADAWARALREAFGSEKEAAYSGRLIRLALLGLFYPIGLVAALAVARALARRAQARLLVPRERRGIRVGPVHLLTTDAERAFLARIVGLTRWVVSIALVYGLLVAMFRQIPATRDWAAAMVRPIADLAADAGSGLLALVPRVLVLLAALIVLRLALRAVTRLFDQVRRREVGLGPLVSAENATPVEKTIKIVLIAAVLVLGALILPGEGGRTVAAALLLAGLALALGARRKAADLVAGLVVVYGRPFRTGQRIRVGRHEGTVVRKGLLHTVVTGRDGNAVLVPNRVVLGKPLAVIDPGSGFRGTVVLEAAGPVDAALDLVRRSLADAGLDPGLAGLRIDAVRDGRLVVAVDAPADAPGELCRDRFLRALLDRAAAGGARVIDAP